MPPKRAASRTRAPKDIPAASGDLDKEEKKTRSAKASSVSAKASPPVQEVEATKPKSRGRPKKTVQVVDEVKVPEIVESPVKNAKGRKAKVAEEVSEPIVAPKKGRGRKPAVADLEPENASTGSRNPRSRSKTPVKKSKSPAKPSKSPAKRGRSPANRESKKTPSKKGTTAKSPVKGSRAKSQDKKELKEDVPAKKESRARSPAKKESRADSPSKKTRGRSPTKKAVKSPTKKAVKLPVIKAAKAVPSKTKSRSEAVVPEVTTNDEHEEEASGNKLADDGAPTIETEVPKIVEPVKGKRGRKPKTETTSSVELESTDNVQQKEKSSEGVTPTNEVEMTVDEPKEVSEAKPRGRPKRDTAPIQPRVSKPRGRPKAVAPATEAVAPEKVSQESTLVDPAPPPVAVDLPPPVNEETKLIVGTDEVKDSKTESTPMELVLPINLSEERPMEVDSDGQRPNKRKISEEVADDIQLKKPKTQTLSVVQLPKIVGRLMTCGTDNTGELGLRNLGMEKKRPVIVSSVAEPVCLITAGAMHTVAVTVGGSKIYTFGCNDELALGRKTAANGTSAPQITDGNATDPDETLIINNEDTPEAIPTSIQLANNIAKVTAGDSHTAALTEFGCLYIWGCFRDNRGRVGLIPDGKPKCPIGNPVLVMPFETTVVDIASGDNHVIALTENGTVYSFGVGEQGQLGRIDASNVKINDDYSNIELFLKPDKVIIDGKPEVKCDRVWAAGFTSFARTTDGAIYGWGLNNYSQLGFKSDGEDTIQTSPRLIPQFCGTVVSITGGLHHSLALDSEGKVYSWGRHIYGRLGHPGLTADVETPRVIEALKDEKVTQIACGNDCSFAVTESGNLYSWGMFATHLGHKQREDAEEAEEDIVIPRKVTGNKLTNTSFYAVASGSQHAVFISSGEQQNGN